MTPNTERLLELLRLLEDHLYLFTAYTGSVSRDSSMVRFDILTMGDFYLVLDKLARACTLYITPSKPNDLQIHLRVEGSHGKLIYSLIVYWDTHPDYIAALRLLQRKSKNTAAAYYRVISNSVSRDSENFAIAHCADSAVLNPGQDDYDDGDEFEREETRELRRPRDEGSAWVLLS